MCHKVSLLTVFVCLFVHAKLSPAGDSFKLGLEGVADTVSKVKQQLQKQLQDAKERIVYLTGR